jgi:hypothetical protein
LAFFLHPNPNHHTTNLSFKFPLNKCQIVGKTSSFCYFAKRTLFLIKSPQQQQQTLVHRPWLIRVTKNSFGKTKLSLLPYDLPSPFKFSLDFNRFSVLHLGTDFIIDIYKGPMPLSSFYPKKAVAITPLILAVILYNDHIALLRYGDHECSTDIADLSATCILDICVFKGRMYLVEEHSIKTVIVGQDDLSVELVAKYVHNGECPDRRFLVESEGELFLMDVHECFAFQVSFEDALTINVFRLDEKEKEWVKLTSLGDRVLFVGNGCSFFASASDLCVTEGNCVIFMDDIFKDDKICRNGMVIYHYDQYRLSHLCDYPDYLNLFWPPPEWILTDCVHKPKKSMLSCIERFLM